jgi:hypothetical protein
MAYYFVAQTKETGFVGQFTLEEIAERFRAGHIPGDYVATKSDGSSYAELLRSGTATWIPVAQLVATLLPQGRELPPPELATALPAPGALQRRDVQRQCNILCHGVV